MDNEIVLIDETDEWVWKKSRKPVHVDFSNTIKGGHILELSTIVLLVTFDSREYQIIAKPTINGYHACSFKAISEYHVPEIEIPHDHPFQEYLVKEE